MAHYDPNRARLDVLQRLSVCESVKLMDLVADYGYLMVRTRRRTTG